MKDREWKDVPEYEKYYQVSNHGEIFSKRRNIVMKLCKDADGYMKMSFHGTNNKRRTITIHRIVAEAFLDKASINNEVNHINGIKSDNRAVNLEWCTRSQNIKHAFDLKLKFTPRGENHPLAKLSPDQVRNIRSMREKGFTAKVIGEKFNIGTSHVYRIAKGFCRSEVT